MLLPLITLYVAIGYFWNRATVWKRGETVWYGSLWNTIFRHLLNMYLWPVFTILALYKKIF
jgi:hypothetical protein